jgi:hypothetical protein
MVFLLGVLPGTPGFVLMVMRFGFEGRARSRRLARGTTIRLARADNGLGAAGPGFGR